MPTNFNQSVDTVTPDIRAYGDAGGSVSGYDIGTGLAAVADVFEAFAKQRQENEKANTIAGVADAYLEKRNELQIGLADIQAQQNDALAHLNPQDAASIKEFQARVNTLNAAARQLRRDNGAQILALTRQAINQYPHLTEEIISASKGSEDLFSNVFVEADSSGLIDEKDARIKYANDVQNLALAAGVSVDYAAGLLRNEQSLKEQTTKAGLARLRGENMIPYGLSYANGLWTSAINSVGIVARKAATPELAEAEAYRIYNVAETKLTQWIDEQAAAGVTFQQQDVQQLRDALKSQLSPLLSFARNLAHKEKSPSDEVSRDKDAIFFLAAASAYTAQNNPMIAQMVTENPKKFMDEYWKPLQGVVKKLAGVNFADLQRTAKGGGASGAEASAKLRALEQVLSVEQAQALFQFGTESSYGKQVQEQYANIIESIHNGTFDPTKIPRGGVTEMLMVASVFDAKNDSPATEDAGGKVIQDQYTPRTSGVQPNYEQGTKTMERLLTVPSFVNWLSNHDDHRTWLVNQAQHDVENFAAEYPAVLNNLTVNTAAIMRGDWKEKNLFTYKTKLTSPTTSGQFSAGIPGAGALAVSAEALTQEEKGAVDLLNMRARLLLRWTNPSNPQEAVQWLKDNLLSQRELTLSDLITGGAGNRSNTK